LEVKCLHPLWERILRSMGYKLWAFMRLSDGRFVYIPYEGREDWAKEKIAELEAEGAVFLEYRLWKP